jgi:hypothetical protein
LEQFEYLNGCNGCFAVSFGQMSSNNSGLYFQTKQRPSKQNELPNKKASTYAAQHAKPPRTHARTAAASSPPRAALSATCGDFAAASRPQDRRIRTAIVRHRRGTAPDPRPRSGCTPRLSCAADARGCTELGSRAKPGLGPRRSPQSAVLHRRRTKCRFAIALRSRGASARLRRYARERPQPGAAAGCKVCPAWR